MKRSANKAESVFVHKPGFSSALRARYCSCVDGQKLKDKMKQDAVQPNAREYDSGLHPLSKCRLCHGKGFVRTQTGLGVSLNYENLR